MNWNPELSDLPPAPPTPAGERAKRCPRCERELPLSEFTVSRHPRSGGVVGYCRWCDKNRAVEYQRRRRLQKLTTPELRRALELARKSVRQIEEILAARDTQPKGG